MDFPKYHKIQSVYKRHWDGPDKGKFMLGSWSTPEIGYLSDNVWEWTEKVDGTNIRIGWSPDLPDKVEIGGRTDNAQIPSRLLNRLNELFTAEKFQSTIASVEDDFPPIVLYGEGYGAKIQKGGGNYIPDGVDFVLFDVRIGSWWLKREDVEDIAARLGIRTVPVVGSGTIAEAISFVRMGISSDWGDFEAEGLVMRPKVEMQDRAGRRIITKLKGRDFK